jgi:hypothetical protein
MGIVAAEKRCYPLFMRKLHLMLAILVAGAAVSVGAVVAFAHGSPQQAPASGKQTPSEPTAAGHAGPAAPVNPTVRPANPQSAAQP